MDINEPTNSRQLSILIQGLNVEERELFLKEARKAEDMESFIKFYFTHFA